MKHASNNCSVWRLQGQEFRDSTKGEEHAVNCDLSVPEQRLMGHLSFCCWYSACFAVQNRLVNSDTGDWLWSKCWHKSCWDLMSLIKLVLWFALQTLWFDSSACVVPESTALEHLFSDTPANRSYCFLGWKETWKNQHFFWRTEVFSKVGFNNLTRREKTEDLLQLSSSLVLILLFKNLTNRNSSRHARWTFFLSDAFTSSVSSCLFVPLPGEDL